MHNVKNAYNEVSTFLNLIRQEEREMIPSDILKKLESYKDYKSLSFNNGELVLSDEAKSIILYLYETYIISDDKELKKAYKDKLKENDRVYKIIKSNQKEIRKDDIILNELFTSAEEKVEEKAEKAQEKVEKVENLPAEKRDNFFTKIISFVKGLFSK